MITTILEWGAYSFALTDKSTFKKSFTILDGEFKMVDSKTVISYSYFELHNELTNIIKQNLGLHVELASKVIQDLLDEHIAHTSRVLKFGTLRKCVAFKRLLKCKPCKEFITEGIFDLMYMCYCVFFTKHTWGKR